MRRAPAMTDPTSKQDEDADGFSIEEESPGILLLDAPAQGEVVRVHGREHGAGQ